MYLYVLVQLVTPLIKPIDITPTPPPNLYSPLPHLPPLLPPHPSPLSHPQPSLTNTHNGHCVYVALFLFNYFHSFCIYIKITRNVIKVTIASIIYIHVPSSRQIAVAHSNITCNYLMYVVIPASCNLHL